MMLCVLPAQVLPEGQFITEIGNDQFEGVIRKISGDAAVAEWRHLQEVMRPLAKAATTLPPAAIRLDPGTVLPYAVVCWCFTGSVLCVTCAEQCRARSCFRAGAALTVGVRYAPQLLGGGWQSFQLLRPFSEVCRAGRCFPQKQTRLLSGCLSG